MTRVIGVRFRTAGKIYYFDPGNFEIKKGDHVIVETARGVEYGTVLSDPKDVDDSEVTKPLKAVLRMANEKDDEQEKSNRVREKDAFRICKEKIIKHGLEMKLIDAEYTFDNNKVLFYFTADGRIDFRDLVKDLASEFKTRIELRQIGVRDETKIIGGYGICGRPLCCHSYLSDFIPVSIKMAKEQNLSLNPTKISGVCGRLMCCLKNEEDVYEELNRKMPGLGDIVKTSDNLEGEVASVNILRQTVRILVDVDDEKEVHECHVDDLTLVRKKQKHKQNQPKEKDIDEEALKALERQERNQSGSQDRNQNGPQDRKQGGSEKRQNNSEKRQGGSQDNRKNNSGENRQNNSQDNGQNGAGERRQDNNQNGSGERRQGNAQDKSLPPQGEGGPKGRMRDQSEGNAPHQSTASTASPEGGSQVNGLDRQQNKSQVNDQDRQQDKSQVNDQDRAQDKSLPPQGEGGTQCRMRDQREGNAPHQSTASTASPEGGSQINGQDRSQDSGQINGQDKSQSRDGGQNRDGNQNNGGQNRDGNQGNGGQNRDGGQGKDGNQRNFDKKNKRRNFNKKNRGKNHNNGGQNRDGNQGNGGQNRDGGQGSNNQNNGGQGGQNSNRQQNQNRREGSDGKQQS
nr:regulatory iron-sulfur-containing complex subunit RicT [Butyrivibrio sp. VCD2006]